MPRIKQHGGLVDVLSDGSVSIKPVSTKGSVNQGKFNTALDAGANDTYVITLTPPLTAYITGQLLWFKANTANTGAATLNVNGLGAKAIKKVAGGITTVLADNDIRAGQYVCVIYDGTNFQMLSASGNADAGGDVVGPGSATAGHVAIFDGVTGKLLKDSGAEAFIADPTGGATTDAEARTAIAAILDLLIAKGLMAAS